MDESGTDWFSQIVLLSPMVRIASSSGTEMSSSSAALRSRAPSDSSYVSAATGLGAAANAPRSHFVNADQSFCRDFGRLYARIHFVGCCPACAKDEPFAVTGIRVLDDGRLELSFNGVLEDLLRDAWAANDCGKRRN